MKSTVKNNKNIQSFFFQKSFLHAFTILELLIVIAIIALISITALVLINPFKQIGKGNDAKRIHDLNKLVKLFEDYYNDKGCYPKPQEVCYDTPVNVCNGVWGSNLFLFKSQVCHICGDETDPPSFSILSPYISKLPCDPQHSTSRYLYDVAAQQTEKCGNTSADITSSCPQWYRIYTDLSNRTGQASIVSDCVGGGCGLTARTSDPILKPYPFGYEYGVNSPQIKLNSSVDFWIINELGVCNSCGGGYMSCIQNGYADKDIYVDKSSCCAVLPMPGGCP